MIFDLAVVLQLCAREDEGSIPEHGNIVFFAISGVYTLSSIGGGTVIRVLGIYQNKSEIAIINLIRFLEENLYFYYSAGYPAKLVSSTTL